jgi:1-acyl-sn-glycerol-3-phosphate acyltransferase
MDYSKYLGPDWKPEYKGAASLVSNHSGWLDILTLFYVKKPSLVSKEGVKKWPIVGLVAQAIGTYFLDRAGTKEERLKMVEKIGERQKKSAIGEFPPIGLFPEGCTTNNTRLIQFKRGAFFSLQSVQPVTFKYYSPYFSPAHDILDVFSHIILICC